MRVLLIEDEVLISENLKMIVELNGYEIAGQFDSAEDLLAWDGEFDFAFVDINLNGDMDGIDLMNRMSSSNRQFDYVFLSDVDDQKQIKRAIATQPMSYLSKPFKKKDILIALQLAEKNFKNKAGESEVKLDGDVLFVKDGDKLISINRNEIIFVKGQGSYSHIHHGKSKTVVSQNLAEVHRKIGGFLLRPHRSYLVNPLKIDQIQNRTEVIIGDEVISIGDAYKAEFFNKINIL